jgi:hypothetical protein
MTTAATRAEQKTTLEQYKTSKSDMVATIRDEGLLSGLVAEN